jgi:hypothetical protein
MGHWFSLHVFAWLGRGGVGRYEQRQRDDCIVRASLLPTHQPTFMLLIRYGAAFAMCTLLHFFDRAGGNARDAGAEKTRGKYVSTKGDLLQAIKGRRDGSGSGRGYISSSDADGGMEEEGSSNDDDDQGQGKRGWKHPKRSTAPSSNLSSSLMGALALPPPAPLSMTSEEFVRDFLSKYPPAPKSYEVTAAIVCFVWCS